MPEQARAERSGGRGPARVITGAIVKNDHHSSSSLILYLVSCICSSPSRPRRTCPCATSFKAPFWENIHPRLVISSRQIWCLMNFAPLISRLNEPDLIPLGQQNWREFQPSAAKSGISAFWGPREFHWSFIGVSLAF